MTVRINKAPREDISSLISSYIEPNMDAVELKKFKRFVLVSQGIWFTEIHGEFIGMWGVIPPTLLSDSAYLWSYVNEKVTNCQFVFIRHSQIAIAKLLEDYVALHGHSAVGASKSIRWLKWLGAEFHEPEGNLIPFVIRRKDG